MGCAWRFAPATSHCVQAFMADEKSDDAPGLRHGDIFGDTIEVARQFGQRDKGSPRKGSGCQLVRRVTLARAGGPGREPFNEPSAGTRRTPRFERVQMSKLVTEKRPVAIAGGDNEDTSRLALLNEPGERAARQSAHVIAGVQEEQVGWSRRVGRRGHPEQGEQIPTYHSHGLGDGLRVSVGGAAAREMQASAGYGDRAPVCCRIG
jgi:hypothetical protein